MAKKNEKALPGKTYMAVPLEDSLHKVASEVAKRMNLNTSQFLRRAVVNLIQQNFTDLPIPDDTKQELAKEGQYRRGRPRKDGLRSLPDQSASAPSRPDDRLRVAGDGKKPIGTGG